jgi:hypothetical protein
MGAVGCRLPVMSKICDAKLLEAGMISIFKRQHRKGNGRQAKSHKIRIHNSSVAVTKSNSHITLRYSDYELTRLSCKANSNSSLVTNSQTDYRDWLLLQSNCTTNDEITEVCYTNTTCFPNCRVFTFSVFVKHCKHYNQTSFYQNA